ncbi:hypothetical protein DFA_00313 [Cavenderia fasciculata]|uniref:Uncharacterized protein n=1 Tax=Cavenderia fasciculata TaxID=261658 RepID=F4PY75_CACFS|nr:uncharacterized protein DFA_00313 [Cavenderia fasciculata]EGG19735.1 hypothetical protein DFA_00313 [Cavenderia fasciculata]|eukprot:XP_004358029.1 hypothetical protein DFA_00313 [Cavenderia fasciculata]
MFLKWQWKERVVGCKEWRSGGGGGWVDQDESRDSIYYILSRSLKYYRMID